MQDEQATRAAAPHDFGDRVKSAVLWRSGTQILAQLISWGATLAVIRILDPGDYGLFAMTSVVLVFLNFLNGYGFVSALIQSESAEPIRIRQAFGMLLLLNIALAAIQLFVAAPLAAAYYQEPVVAEMLRWQALIYLSTPFLILPEALMTRELQFKKPALINLATAFVGALVSLVLALNDYGVWCSHQSRCSGAGRSC
jgi:O-antigen/teichoic acid export membrane protein